MMADQYQENALDELWESMLASVDGDGSAAQETLRQGFPIYSRQGDEVVCVL